MSKCFFMNCMGFVCIVVFVSRESIRTNKLL